MSKRDCAPWLVGWYRLYMHKKKKEEEVEEKHQCDILLCQCKLFAVENKVCESLAAISYRVNSDMIAFLIELLC